jgi:hypothetical protein
LWINHQQGPAGAAIQTAGLVDPYAARASQTGRLDLSLATLESLLRAMMAAGVLAVAALIEAKENMVPVVGDR